MLPAGADALRAADARHDAERACSRRDAEASAAAAAARELPPELSELRQQSGPFVVAAAVTAVTAVAGSLGLGMRGDRAPRRGPGRSSSTPGAQHIRPALPSGRCPVRFLRRRRRRRTPPPPLPFLPFLPFLPMTSKAPRQGAGTTSRASAATEGEA